MSEDVTTFMQPDCMAAADVLPPAERWHDWQKHDARAKRLKPSDEMNVVPSATSGSNDVVAHVQLSPPVDPWSDMTIPDEIRFVDDDVWETCLKRKVHQEPVLPLNRSAMEKGLKSNA